MINTFLVPGLFEEPYASEVIQKAHDYEKCLYNSTLLNATHKEKKFYFALWLLLAECRLRKLWGTLDSYYEQNLNSVIPGWFEYLQSNKKSPASLLDSTLNKYEMAPDAYGLFNDYCAIYEDDWNFCLNYGQPSDKKLRQSLLNKLRESNPDFPDPISYFNQF